MTNPVKSIGVDLDNTIIDYGPAYPHVARSLGIPGPATRPRLRAALKQQDDLLWQRFQSLLYTEGLAHAVPAPGSIAFLHAVSQAHIDVQIVSHKTATTPEEFGARPLREPALDWLHRYGIVPALVDRRSVLFCATRDDKVGRIRDAGFDWFVDDLQEVLDHPDFPVATRGWWYNVESPGSIGAAEADALDGCQHVVPSPSTVDFFVLLERLRAESEAC